MLGGFPLPPDLFRDFRGIRSFGYICRGFNVEVLWNHFAQCLAELQPTSVLIEDCVFVPPTDNELCLTPLPRVATLSLLDSSDEMLWMAKIWPAFPEVTSLCLHADKKLLCLTFPSLRHLTLTNPSAHTDCKLLPLGNTLAGYRLY